jgi:GT2 family glycosyltransferase
MRNQGSPLVTPKIPLISVVILNRNRLHFLKQTLPNILRLNYPRLECIVVDNASTDGSREYIRSFPQVKLIELETNIGFSAGKNLGIKLAKGEFILSLDNDILIQDQDLLQKLVANYSGDTGFLQIPLIDKGTSKTYYYGTFFTFYGLNMHRPKLTLEQIQQNGDLVRVGGATGGCFFISKDHWQLIGGFDEAQAFHLDDVDVGPRAWILGYENRLLTTTHATHIGIDAHDDLQTYVQRFSLVFSGHGRAMLKNYRMMNLLYCFPIFCCYSLLKAIRYSLLKGSSKVFWAFCGSMIRFLKYLPESLRLRQELQKKRIIADDVFLRIKPNNLVSSTTHTITEKYTKIRR